MYDVVVVIFFFTPFDGAKLGTLHFKRITNQSMGGILVGWANMSCMDQWQTGDLI